MMGSSERTEVIEKRHTTVQRDCGCVDTREDVRRVVRDGDRVVSRAVWRAGMRGRVYCRACMMASFRAG